MARVLLALPVLSLCNTLGTSLSSRVAQLTPQLDEAVEALLSELRTTMNTLSDVQKKEVRKIADDIEDAIDQCVTATKVLSKDPNAEGLLKKARGTSAQAVMRAYGASADRLAHNGSKEIDIRDIWEEEERQKLKAVAEWAKKELEERARTNPEYNPYI